MEYGAYSRQGIRRKTNEDHYYIPQNVSEQPGVIIVADGMGGHNAGDLASRIAVEEICSYFKRPRSSDDLLNVIHQSVQKANSRVYALSGTDARYSGMGTTLTMAVFERNRFLVANIGDSRCYLLRNGTARQITRDHSLVQELLDNGSITRDEMNLHPKKNVITRALGTEQSLRVDCFEENLKDGDIVLLCTDGLINYVHLEDYVPNLPTNLSMARLTEILGNEALSSGSTDDITIVAARYVPNEEKR